MAYCLPFPANSDLERFVGNSLTVLGADHLKIEEKSSPRSIHPLQRKKDKNPFLSIAQLGPSRWSIGGATRIASRPRKDSAIVNIFGVVIRRRRMAQLASDIDWQFVLK